MSDPTTPLAVSPAWWNSRGGHHRALLHDTGHSSRRVSRSSRVYAVDPIPVPRPAARPRSSLELWFPTAHSGSEGPLGHGLCLPASFRLQGLATLLTAYALRSLIGLVSSRQRPWDFTLRSLPLPQGIDGVPAAMDPHIVHPSLAPADESAGRCDGPRPLGFDPCESPLPQRMPLSLAAARYSPGLSPFQGHHRRA